LSKNELKSAQIFLEKHTIRVPFDGVVVDVFARKGEAISPSSSGNSSIRTGLIRLIDPTDLYIEVEVPEQYITKISSHHDVMISIPNQDSNEIQDQVKWIAPVSSRQRGVIQIGINLPNGINNIVDGMELNVRFINLPKNIVKINN
jgi:multidrug resistance efflux pump